MKNLIRKILKESFDQDYSWLDDVREFNPAEGFLYDIMSNTEKKELPNEPNKMVYEDPNGKVIMATNRDRKSNFLYVDQEDIVKKMEINFGLDYPEIRNMCKDVFKMVYGKNITSVVNTNSVIDQISRNDTVSQKNF